MTALCPADFWGSRRSFMASKTWESTVSTPAALTNSLISSSDRPSSSWARASGLLASLMSVTRRNTIHRAERLLRRLRAAELHRLRPVADRRPDPAQRLAAQPRSPTPGLRGVSPLRPARAHEPARPRRSQQYLGVASVVRTLRGGGRHHPGLHPVLAGPHTTRAALAGGVHRVDHPVRPRSEEHTSELQSRQYLVCR